MVIASQCFLVQLKKAYILYNFKVYRLKKSILLFLVFFSTLAALAQVETSTVNSENVITKRVLSVKDGMAARDVICAVEDKDGFMWFGTSNGLCRYDGNSFKTFTKQNFGLLANEIASLCIDDKNHLIIEFNNKTVKVKIKGGIQVIDLKNYTLQTLESIYPKLPFKTKDVVFIANDENKKLFFITNSSYQVWNYTSVKGFKLLGELTAWNTNKDIAKINNAVTSIYSIVQNGSIVLKKNSYPSYLITDDTVIPFSNKPEESIFSITKNNSLLLYNTVSNAISKRDFPDAVSSFATQNQETFLHLYPVGDYIWNFHPPYSDDSNIVYNLEKGIYLIDDKSFFLIAKPEEIRKYTNFFINSTFKDSRGDRWLCTNSGVIQISIKPNHITRYFSKQQGKTTSFNQVRGIYADNSFDLMDNKATTTLYANVWHYLCISKAKLNSSELSYATTACPYNALLKHNNKFYIGGVNTIYEYEPTRNKAIEIGVFGDNLVGSYIWSLTALSDSILLAGHEKGVSSFNIISKRSKALVYNSQKIPKAKDVYRFVTTKTKGLVAVAENGLFLIDKNNVVVDYYGSLVNDKSHHLPISIIYDMLEDKNGICWIASNGEGLFRWDWKQSVTDKPIKTKQFTIKEGLPSMVLYRIEEDEANNLWIGSYNGLLRFNTINFSTSTYTTDDGLTHNEFNRTSSFKAVDGKMYFGGLDGVNAFYPKKLLESDTKKEASLQMIALNKFSGKNNKLLDCLIDFKQAKKIILAAGDSFLTLEFQLLDFQERKHLYAYKIDGIDADWNYIDENTIRLSGLPYGVYKMHIKAQLKNGQWGSNPIVFTILVMKPFYLQLWFLIAAVLLMVAGFVFYFRFRTNRLNAENHRLELKVDSRTAALKKSLADRELLLIEIHHRVKNNLQVISGLLELQKEQLVDKKTRDAFSESQSRVGSIALIHQNLYQNENLGNIEFSSFIRDLSSKVAELFENQGNKVTFVIEKKEVYLDIDTAVPLGLILNELLTNSYKCFLKGTQENKISIKLTRTETGTHELLYKDNGPGLKQEIDFNTATSLGLKLIRGLSKQLHGKAKYTFENGSVFTIKFKDSVARKE